VIRADCVVAGCRELVTCAGAVPKRGAALGEAAAIPDGWIAARDGRIVFAGSEAEFRRSVDLSDRAVRIDGGGLVGLPGFVDSHTHLPFGGDRSAEFSLRLKGWTYQQLAAQGMGIRTTVRATRAAGAEELKSACLGRLDRMLLHGTTTVEAKSGYGLNLADELKQLEVIAAAGREHPIDLIPTFMGAHEVPEEYRSNKEGYIDLLIHEVLPAVRHQGLARFFDVFCEEGVFSVEESERLVQAGAAAGLGIKIHADEFASLGGAELAARVGAVSAEHLISISERGVQALAASPTAAILLPGVPFFLRQDKRAPARGLIDAGAAVALATDFNPGSSMTLSMPFILQLGVFTLKMNVEEAVNAVTANAAYAIREENEAGRLEPGLKMDLALFDIPNHLHLAYQMGDLQAVHVIKKGRPVVTDGRLSYQT
jgi:imidazolonepropionase